MRISIIIPNYNGEELLKKNLPKVLKAIGDTEVIIVDDASTDGSVKNIKYQISNLKNTNQKSNIKLIRNKKNLGFSSAVNRGVREAEGELIVLLNTDLYPEKNFLLAALPHFEDPKVFAIGCLQKCRENGKIIERGRGIGIFKKGFLLHKRGEVDKSNTLWVSGGAGVFRKSIWEKLGGFNELYNPFYWEDIDLSYRALKTGFQLVFEPRSVVYHHQEEGAIKSLYEREEVKTIAYRNQILFVWLNITDRLYLLQHLIHLPYHIIKALFAGDFAFIHGIFQAIKLLPLVLSHRERNEKFAQLQDAAVLQGFTL